MVSSWTIILSASITYILVILQVSETNFMFVAQLNQTNVSADVNSLTVRTVTL